MKTMSCYKYLACLLLMVTGTMAVQAEEGKPVRKAIFDYAGVAPLLTDSVPETVKEVPKSRKQQVPVPVSIEVKPIQVKPIQVIKPKIIKPVIKAIH